MTASKTTQVDIQTTRRWTPTYCKQIPGGVLATTQMDVESLQANPGEYSETIRRWAQDYSENKSQADI